MKVAIARQAASTSASSSRTQERGPSARSSRAQQRGSSAERAEVGLVAPEVQAELRPQIPGLSQRRDVSLATIRNLLTLALATALLAGGDDPAELAAALASTRPGATSDAARTGTPDRRGSDALPELTITIVPAAPADEAAARTSGTSLLLISALAILLVTDEMKCGAYVRHDGVGPARRVPYVPNSLNGTFWCRSYQRGLPRGRYNGPPGFTHSRIDGVFAAPNGNYLRPDPHRLLSFRDLL
ncbi:hypothetical protein K1T71_015048 [Dendrolimus kikuchii]|nr:hypothetical protein K1T71_015048 [Dendrolimus kikuchii]